MMKTMRKIIPLLLAFCFMFYLSGVALAASLLMEVNQSKHLDSGSSYEITSVAIANPEIADVTVLSRSEMLVIAKKVGTTTLVLWTADGMRQEYAVNVQNRDTETAIAIEGLIGYPGVTIEKISDQLLLRGTVSNQLEKNRAEKIAQMYGAKDAKVVNLLELTQPTQIRLEAKIVEISTDRVKDLGLSFANAAKIENGIVTLGSSGVFGIGQSFTNSRDPGSSRIGDYAPINATLNALISNGEAKILSQPSMVTMSGEKADILVGGEIPIPVSNQNGQVTVEWRSYGIKLHIEPVVDESDRITSKVMAEVSSLDWNSSVAVNTNGLSIPALRSRKAETVISLPSGNTMAIGGLLSSEESRQVQKIPLLGDLPILGQFFRNTTTSRDRKEVIILITPTLVDETTALHISDEMKSLLADKKSDETATKKK